MQDITIKIQNRDNILETRFSDIVLVDKNNEALSVFTLAITREFFAINNTSAIDSERFSSGLTVMEMSWTSRLGSIIRKRSFTYRISFIDSVAVCDEVFSDSPQEGRIINDYLSGESKMSSTLNYNVKSFVEFCSILISNRVEDDIASQFESRWKSTLEDMRRDSNSEIMMLFMKNRSHVFLQGLLKDPKMLEKDKEILEDLLYYGVTVYQKKI